MTKIAKILIPFLSLVLVAIVAFDVFLVKTGRVDELLPQGDAPVADITTEQYADPIERQARQLLENMTLWEKIGQMLLYYIPKEDPLPKMEHWQFGGYIFFERNFEYSTPGQTFFEVAEYQTAAKIPAFIAVDEEGGGVTRISQFPQYRYAPFESDARLYREGGFDLVVQNANEKSQFLKDLGFNTLLAPVADVPYSAYDYIYTRAFSTDEELVCEYITRTVEAYNRNGIFSCVKHFPGYASNRNTHTEMSTDYREWASLEQRDLKPFQAAVDAGVPFLMVSHNIIEDFDSGVPASLSLKLHNYIREDMHYDGIIVCDGLGMKGVRDYVNGDKGEVAVQAVLGGNDMLCATDVGVQLRAIASAVEQGRIDEKQIDDSVVRILMTKIKYGLIEQEN